MKVILFALLCSLASLASAQFQFFEQMFNQGGQQQQQHHQQQPQNVASDSEWYQRTYESGTILSSVCRRSRNIALTSSQLAAHCSNYLCPGTLACVHFPHHCPCPFPAVEDKVELGEGSAICVSKGGWKEGEAARKIELARKGML
ncbi:hypothetical protein BDR22DRAFT_893917 [Usnea florida]